MATKSASKPTKSVLIVESPAKGKTIEGYLGKGYKVVASYGHVRDLPKSKLGIDVEHDFEPQYMVPRGQASKIKALNDAGVIVEAWHQAGARPLDDAAHRDAATRGSAAWLSSRVPPCPGKCFGHAITPAAWSAARSSSRPSTSITYRW